MHNFDADLIIKIKLKSHIVGSQWSQCVSGGVRRTNIRNFLRVIVCKAFSDLFSTFSKAMIDRKFVSHPWTFSLSFFTSIQYKKLGIDYLLSVLAITLCKL